MKKLIVCSSVIFLALGLIAVSPMSGRCDEEIIINPKTLALHSHGIMVTVHTNIPYNLVDYSSLELSGDGGGAITADKVNMDNKGCVYLLFSVNDVAKIVSVPSTVLTLTGSYIDGDDFSASATITVTE
jgi:hypothetical protein